MCLLIFAFRPGHQFPLILAGNRDEYFARESRDAGFWSSISGAESVLAGQDLSGRGTWLGINLFGRFAAVTNIRGQQKSVAEKSRGLLPLNFLLGEFSPLAYAEAVARERNYYAGFNLLAGNPGELAYLDSRDGKPQLISSGVHGLSNGTLNEPWPKVVSGRQLMTNLLQQFPGPGVEQLLPLLMDRNPGADRALPRTGVPLELERRLSSAFISIPENDYGTRCSTALVMDAAGLVRFAEQNYARDGSIRSINFHQFRLRGK